MLVVRRIRGSWYSPMSVEELRPAVPGVFGRFGVRFARPMWASVSFRWGNWTESRCSWSKPFVADPPRSAGSWSGSSSSASEAYVSQGTARGKIVTQTYR
jgi:hypothetical protein